MLASVKKYVFIKVAFQDVFEIFNKKVKAKILFKYHATYFISNIYLTSILVTSTYLKNKTLYKKIECAMALLLPACFYEVQVI